MFLIVHSTEGIDLMVMQDVKDAAETIGDGIEMDKNNEE